MDQFLYIFKITFAAISAIIIPLSIFIGIPLIISEVDTETKNIGLGYVILGILCSGYLLYFIRNVFKAERNSWKKTKQKTRLNFCRDEFINFRFPESYVAGSIET